VRDLVLGIDCSTTGVKAVAWDRVGRAAGEGRASFEQLHPAPLYSEQRADDWWRAAVEAIGSLTGTVDVSRIAGICITHQRESFVPVDEKSRALRNAILWDDARSQAELDLLGERFGHDQLHRRTGRGPSVGQAFPKLLWLARREPELAKRTYKFMDVHGFLVQRLTGKFTTSLASADGFGLTDVENQVWADDLITGIGLSPQQFCDTVQPGQVIGAVGDEDARSSGLEAGVPVIAGLGDGQAACLGAGVTSLDRAYLNLGTAVTGGPIRYRYHTTPYCRTVFGGAPNTFLLETVIRGGLATMTWFMRRFGDSLNEPATFATYEARAREVGPGSSGLVIVPYWNNVMNPYWDPSATGIAVGWTHGHGREHLFRAVEEGLAYEFRVAMDGIQASTGERIREYVILGGGSNSDLWCQIMADVLGATVTRARSAESTNLGAGILCACGVGWYSSVEEAAAAMTEVAESFHPEDSVSRLYDALFTEVYRPLFPAIQPQLQRLSQLRAAVHEEAETSTTDVM
jgi:sugar (pentulose or hexulose) kinase